MILSEHKLMPPPPYAAADAESRRGGSGNGGVARLSALPPHFLLHIVEATFPPDALLDAVSHRRALYWLTTDLRLVCRGLYIACMHILRSTYLPDYSYLVKPPYTSDPFPLGAEEERSGSVTGTGSDNSPAAPPLPPPPPVIRSLQRETEVLDLFIVLKARQDVLLDESYLHLESQESFNDLFMLMQPRKRIEDLLRLYGLRYGFVTLSDDDDDNDNDNDNDDTRRSHSRIPFSRLSISFSSRKVGLVLTEPSSSKSKLGPRRGLALALAKRTTILECERGRDEKLEVVAKRLAKALGRWIAAGGRVKQP